MSDYDVTAGTDRQPQKGPEPGGPGDQLQRRAVDLPLPLAEFAKAYDGPPTDPKVFEETQKKLQEELQKRRRSACQARGQPACRCGGQSGGEVNFSRRQTKRRSFERLFY